MTALDNIEIMDVVQGSDEWLAVRAGLVTGSKASVVMMKDNASGGEPAGKKDYRLQLAVERLTGQPQLDDFYSRHTRHGHEAEPMARMETERKHGILIRQTGFIRRKDIKAGVSLDGDVNNFRAIAEIKCPKSTTHLDYMRGGKVPAVYRWQVVHGMFIVGAKEAYFTSYDNRMPDGLDLFTIRVQAKDYPMEDYEIMLNDFIKSVDTLEQELRYLQERRLREGNP